MLTVSKQLPFLSEMPELVRTKDTFTAALIRTVGSQVSQRASLSHRLRRQRFWVYLLPPEIFPIWMQVRSPTRGRANCFTTILQNSAEVWIPASSVQLSRELRCAPSTDDSVGVQRMCVAEEASQGRSEPLYNQRVLCNEVARRREDPSRSGRVCAHEP